MDGGRIHLQCPHCAIHFRDNWYEVNLNRGPQGRALYWKYRTAICPGCSEITIELSNADTAPVDPDEFSFQWVQVYPIGSNRGPVPPEVPERIAQDYVEACRVLPFSAKASAALSRRCLQTILHEHG